MLEMMNCLLVTTALEPITLVEVHLGLTCIDDEAVEDIGTIILKFQSWAAVVDLVSTLEVSVKAASL